MSQSYAKSPAAERKFTTREMVLVGMFAAVLAVISQISLPMPTGVPITIQVFGVALVGAVLGSRLGTTATLVYVLLGAIGLPIFANSPLSLLNLIVYVSNCLIYASLSRSVRIL